MFNEEIIMEERDEEDFKKATECYISNKPPVGVIMVECVIIAMLASAKALIKFGIFALPVYKNALASRRTPRYL